MNKNKQTKTIARTHTTTFTNAYTLNHMQRPYSICIYRMAKNRVSLCYADVLYYMTGTGRSNVLGNRLKILQ